MVTKHEQFVGFKVYSAQRSIHRSLEAALKPYELTPGQWNVLNQLDRAGELSQKALADTTRKEQATITRYLDTLEKKELVVRERDKNDRRAHVVSVTGKTHELLKSILPVVEQAGDSLLTDIDKSELETFLGVLTKLEHNAEAYINEQSPER